MVPWSSEEPEDTKEIQGAGLLSSVMRSHSISPFFHTRRSYPGKKLEKGPKTELRIQEAELFT